MSEVWLWTCCVLTSCRRGFLVLPHDSAVWDAGEQNVNTWNELLFLLKLLQQIFKKDYIRHLAHSHNNILQLPTHMCFLSVCSYWMSCQWFTAHASLSTVCKWISLCWNKSHGQQEKIWSDCVWSTPCIAHMCSLYLMDLLLCVSFLW